MLLTGTPMAAAAAVLAVAVVVAISSHAAEARKAKEGRTSRRAPPRFGQTHLHNHTVRVGNEVRFSCIVHHLGDFRVAWLHSVKGTLAVHPDVITQNDRIAVSYDNRETYSLKLSNVQESDAGVYICQINTGPAISISGDLSVVVPPDILDDESSSDTLATEGMRVLLNCRARGNPPPTISWVREDGKMLRLCKEKKDSKLRASSLQDEECQELKTHFGADLELIQVSRFDSGTYLCLANNGVPPTVSKRVQLYVDFAPTIWISHQRVGAQLGDTVELECLTAAHPPSLNSWSKDGDDYIVPRYNKYILTQNIGEPSHYNIQMRLKIVNVTESDFGLYKCIARNSQGDSNSDITLYEIPRPSTTTPAFDFAEYEWRKKMAKELPSSPPSTPYGRANETTSVILLHQEVLNEIEGDVDMSGNSSDKRRERKLDRRGRRRDRKRHQKNRQEQNQELNAKPDERYHSLNHAASLDPCQCATVMTLLHALLSATVVDRSVMP